MDPKNITKRYSNDDITVVWKPSACIHSTICWNQTMGLPEVFNPRERPWVKIDGASTDRIIEQVQKCPSGALTFYYNDATSSEPVSIETKVEVMPNGPLLVYGNIVVKDHHGVESKKTKVTAFCRCGLSGNKPYCDGSHIRATGLENTASEQ
jgi:CDGSH-type Zn-finger protein/uncharacterized Fe-S cluster protein YjdI